MRPCYDRPDPGSERDTRLKGEPAHVKPFNFPTRTTAIDIQYLERFTKDAEALFETVCSSISQRDKGYTRTEQEGGGVLIKGSLYAQGIPWNIDLPKIALDIKPDTTRFSARLSVEPAAGAWELIIPIDEFIKKYDEVGRKYKG